MLDTHFDPFLSSNPTTKIYDLTALEHIFLSSRFDFFLYNCLRG